MLFKEDLFGILEAALFVSVEPLDISKISEILGINQNEAKDIISEFKELLLLPGRGIVLTNVAGGYKLMTKNCYSNILEKVVKPQGGQLSKPALETLAIIAYKQPITRSEIEEIRGVNVDAMVHKLLEKELIIEVGRKEVPGHPNLYGTTDKFLIQLGLNSLEDLPELILEEDNISNDDIEKSNNALEMEILSKV
ncbi:MAG: SMC-Scp complex subunit ScpB [Fusobacteria bacterium]|nr:SMC-Scp complex subunit ScpB [Fusobacteriota bacterium]